MTAYYFRQVDNEGVPTGYMGMAVGQDKVDLFWLIDEYLDPYSVEIKTAKRGGYCYLQKNPLGPIADGDGFPATQEDDPEDRSEYEFSEHKARSDDDGWKRPDWGIVHKQMAKEESPI